MNFEFATATQIVFGPRATDKLGNFASQLGSHALLVVVGFPAPDTNVIDALYGRGIDIQRTLADAHVDSTLFTVQAEPTIELVEEGVDVATEAKADLVISIGGGSAIDTGKAISALVTNGGSPLDYLEVIGEGRALNQPSLPFIAIPTTAGTGAEVTRNAVVKSEVHKVKVSLRSSYMLPRLALVDPVLTYSLPPEVTASTGLDAFTQVLEPYVSNKANPVTDALCREGLRRGAQSLQTAFEDGHDEKAREDMALVSLLGGLALANAKLGAVHGFAGPIGGMFPAPHGVICARLLPFVIEVNVRALQGRGDSDLLRRYEDVARIVTGNVDATFADGVSWIQELCEALQVPTLSQFGVNRDDILELVEKSAVASSMKGNPVKLTHCEMEEILEKAL